MTNMNWKELVLANEEQIRDALGKIYEEACVESFGAFRATRAAILDKDGNIRFEYSTGNSTDGAVWHGEAIYLGAIEQFIPWEHDDESEWIFPLLTEEQKQEFVKYCEENNSGYITFSALEDFDKDLYQKVVNESIENQIDYGKDNWVEEHFQLLLRELSFREETGF